MRKRILSLGNAFNTPLLISTSRPQPAPHAWLYLRIVIICARQQALPVPYYGARRDPRDGIVPGSTLENPSIHGSLGWALGCAEIRLIALYFREEPEDIYVPDSTQVSGARFADRVLTLQSPNPYANDARTEQSVITLAYTHPQVWGHTFEASIYLHDEKLIQRLADYFQGLVRYINSDVDNERLSALTKRLRAASDDVELTFAESTLLSPADRSGQWWRSNRLHFAGSLSRPERRFRVSEMAPWALAVHRRAASRTLLR